MIKSIIEQEQKRLHDKGYDYEMQTISLPVARSLQQHYLGNDVYILTGIHVSADDTAANMNTIVLSSPTEHMTITQQRMAALGTSAVKVFRDRINIASFGTIMDIVEYERSASDTKAVKALISYFQNSKYLYLQCIHKFIIRFIGHNATYIKSDDHLVEITREHRTIFDANSAYADYIAAMTAADIAQSAMSADIFAKAKTSVQKFGYSYRAATITHDISELASLTIGQIATSEGITLDQDYNANTPALNVLFDYMQYATGEIHEQDITPYELEFVRLIPLQRQ